jgi:hypothetical protein
LKLHRKGKTSVVEYLIDLDFPPCDAALLVSVHVLYINIQVKSKQSSLKTLK